MKIKWRFLWELCIRAIVSVYFGYRVVLFVDPRDLILLLILVINDLFRFLLLLIRPLLAPLRKKDNDIATQENDNLCPKQCAFDFVREYSYKNDYDGAHNPIDRGLGHQSFANEVKQQEVVCDLVQAWKYEDRDHFVY